MSNRAARRLQPLVMPAGIAGLALTVRLYGLDAQSLWLDEIYTLRRAALPLDALISDSATNFHSPLYFLIMSGVLKLSETEWMLRFPSAIFSAVAAGLTAATGRIAAGKHAGILAGLLMALSPSQVLYGQEGRAYALMTSLILCALWGLVRLADTPDKAGRWLWSGSAPHGPWIAYTFGTAIALNTLNAAVLWLFAANLGAAVIAAAAGPGRRAFLGNWLLAHSVIALLSIPYLTIILRPLKQAAAAGFWVPPVTLDFVTSAFSTVYLFHVSDVVMFQLDTRPVPLLGSLLLLLAFLGTWRLRRQPVLMAIIGFALVVPPAALLAASIQQPVFLPRYLIWGAGPFFILAASGLAAFPMRYFVLTAACLSALGVWALLKQLHYESKPRWDWAAHYVSEAVKPGDVILLPRYWTRFVFGAILERAGLRQAQVDVAETIDEGRSTLDAGGRVWVVQGRVGFGKAPTQEEFIRSLASLGTPNQIYEFGNHVFVLRFGGPSELQVN